MRIVVLFFVGILGIGPAWGMLYQKISLETIIQGSDIAFAGKLIDQSTGVVSGKPFVMMTFEVLKPYKGVETAEFKFKQLGFKSADKTIHTFRGLPAFRKGQSYLIFLPTPNKDGFATPNGLISFSLLSKVKNPWKSNAIDSIRVIPTRAAPSLMRGFKSVPGKQWLRRHQDMLRKSDISIGNLKGMEALIEAM